MDISTIIGMIVGFGSLGLAYAIEKGNLLSLLLPSPFITVVGGTIGACIISFGLKGLLGAFKALFRSYSKKNAPSPEALVTKLSEMADMCRKEGLLKLQTLLNDPDLNNDKYLLLKEGMILALDMKPAEDIENALQADLSTYSMQKQLEIEVFEGAGGYSPTMGVIGTVMGLVQVLSNMSDAEHLTAAIAVAFVATLYGVVFANLIYLPAANHLKIALKREKVFREMMVDGICMIASGKSSRDIENNLALYYHAFEGGEKKYKEGINN
ncbi:MAG TPA: MotA/TolQ/ExbB proton channel family protein [Caproiciproducens sp.]|nr:MotA/TolQ/ExbB proton channel family protein [Caproiciproducens sp.]